jgi:hypothetical protein
MNKTEGLNLRDQATCNWRSSLLVQVKAKVKLSLCVIKLHFMKTYGHLRGSGPIPLILNLGASWRGVVSVKSRPPYFLAKSPRHILGRGWVGPRAGLGTGGEEKHLLPHPVNNLWTFYKPKSSQNVRPHHLVKIRRKDQHGQPFNVKLTEYHDVKHTY